MSSLTKALLEQLDDDDLGLLVELIRPRLGTPAEERSTWLDVTAAAQHLACPKSRIYALVSARRIPFHKDGTRTLFDRGELDNWVRAGGANRP
jgi:excisionase family DNA binding protein